MNRTEFVRLSLGAASLLALPMTSVLCVAASARANEESTLEETIAWIKKTVQENGSYESDGVIPSGVKETIKTVIDQLDAQAFRWSITLTTSSRREIYKYSLIWKDIKNEEIYDLHHDVEDYNDSKANYSLMRDCDAVYVVSRDDLKTINLDHSMERDSESIFSRQVKVSDAPVLLPIKYYGRYVSGPKEMNKRLGKAFDRLIKLCGSSTKPKEAF